MYQKPVSFCRVSHFSIQLWFEAICDVVPHSCPPSVKPPEIMVFSFFFKNFSYTLVFFLVFIFIRFFSSSLSLD